LKRVRAWGKEKVDLLPNVYARAVDRGCLMREGSPVSSASVLSAVPAW